MKTAFGICILIAGFTTAYSQANVLASSGIAKDPDVYVKCATKVHCSLAKEIYDIEMACYLKQLEEQQLSVIKSCREKGLTFFEGSDPDVIIAAFCKLEEEDRKAAAVEYIRTLMDEVNEVCVDNEESPECVALNDYVNCGIANIEEQKNNGNCDD